MIILQVIFPRSEIDDFLLLCRHANILIYIPDPWWGSNVLWPHVYLFQNFIDLLYSTNAS